ncbi:hypothetical protein J3R82DRAFT_10688 [Butyriboletus roseoflavus]|nr:hypothetical protein J3R82DRAFT_10688 [Butyriboletus roseoflavus]
MNLPESVDDPSLLNHEPLLSHVTLYETAIGPGRSEINRVVSSFVEAMQRDARAVAATKTWACLLFKEVFLNENSLEAMDGGKELYKAFLEYQVQLSKGRRHGSTDARSCQARILRRGIGAIKLKNRDANTQRSGGEGRGKGHDSQRSSRPHKISGAKKVRRQFEGGVQHPDTELTGDNAISSGSGCGSHSTIGTSANDTLLATGARQSVTAADPIKRSTSKKEKKRKASSQKPPVISPSDASEDDKELPKTRAATVANSMSRRPKRIAPNPTSRQPHDLLAVKNQVDKKNHRPKTNKQHREDTGISQPRSTLTSLRSDESDPPPNTKGRRDAGFPPNGRKPDEASNLNFSTQLSSLRKVKSVRDPQTRATERFRRASMSALDGELREGSKSTHDLQAKEPTIQGPLSTGPPLTQENIHAKSTARRKRTRPEFETGFVVSHKKALADSHESLGPDVRSSRRLPQKVCDRRLVPVADQDTAVRDVPCGAPSLDQLLRDVASNALAMLREGVRPDIQDWTQDEGHDAECDDLDGLDQDEENDIQVTSATSAPSVVIPKPPVPAPPRIWAQSRQEVCESFEYFRCYHSGVYSKDGIVKGYLLGAYASSRDVFHHDGKVIISHGGGKSESILDSRRGPKRYQTDQDQEASDKSVRALLKTCKDRRPIALLADDRYALFPYDLASANYTYVVLGFYWISHAWAECQPTRDESGRIVRWKFAFQWCEGQDDPWWAPQREMKDATSDPPMPISNSTICLTEGSPYPANTGRDPSIQCENCQEQSPFIYKQGWMCLNPHCNMFWSINGEDPKQLDHREEFLSLLPQKFERLPNLTPTRVVKTSGGVTTTYAFSKGWHCTDCGRLSCRFKWEYWECPNCQLKHVVNGRTRSPKEFWHQRPSKVFLHSQVGKDSGIIAARLEPINLGPHKGFTNRLTFILPRDRGKIHLILGTPLSNGDADNIFQLYQQQASTGELKLRRYPLRNVARGLLLTNYFSQNCKHSPLYRRNLIGNVILISAGEPYQYVGGSGQTVPFCEAPDCVQRALALIKERSTLALHTNIPFNEVLSAAYMERQKMSFHSDNEKGLGPTVASLSLGSAALMHFRPHVTMENPKSKSTYALTLVLRHVNNESVATNSRFPSPSTVDLVPRLLRSMSKTQPTQQVTPVAGGEQTGVTPLTHRGSTPAQVEVTTDNSVDPAERSSQTLYAVQTPPMDTRMDDENVGSVVADDPGQSPEPDVPNTFANRVQDMLSAIPSFASTISSGSSRPTPPAPPPTEADDTPSPVHLLPFLTLPNFHNGPFENGWQSFWSALDHLRLPYAKQPENAIVPEPSQDDILDCIDDNNSVMMYGPLEPDDSSEVEIACSEISSGVRGTETKPEFVSGAIGTAQVLPTTEPTADRPLVKEYRVWLPSLTKLSIQTMWWGFRIYLPPPVLDVLNNRQLEAAKRAALITTALQWLMDHLPVSLLPPQMRPGVAILRYLVPYVGYMGGFIAWSWSAIRSFDKGMVTCLAEGEFVAKRTAGYGVVLTATWLLPFVLIPGTWEADEVHTRGTDTRSS